MLKEKVIEAAFKADEGLMVTGYVLQLVNDGFPPRQIAKMAKGAGSRNPDLWALLAEDLHVFLRTKGLYLEFLGAGHLGNGITYWDRRREENGDYRTVAHWEKTTGLTFRDNHGLTKEEQKFIRRWSRWGRVIAAKTDA